MAPERRLAGGLTTAANASRFAHTGLAGNTLYRYRVRAVNTAGASDWSNEAEATTLPSPPLAPAGLVVTTNAPTQLGLLWQDYSDNETAFALFRKSGGSDWVKIATLAPNVIRYTDSGLNPETTYTYRLRAVNQGGASLWSNEASFTTPPLPPAAPAGLTVTAPSATQLDLVWQDNSGTETAFALFRKSGVGDWTRIAVLTPNTTRYSDPGLAADTRYLYRLRAINNGGASAWSNEASGTTGLAAPTGLVVRNASPFLTYLEWSDPNQRETGFELYRRTGDGQWRLLAVLPAGNGAYLDFQVDAGATYTYRVRALGPQGPSGWSNEVRWQVP